MTTAHHHCYRCRQAIPDSEFKYEIHTYDHVDACLCLNCATAGLGNCHSATLMMPEDFTAIQKTLFCGCQDCLRFEGPREILEREATDLARRMVAEIPRCAAAGETDAARIRADLLTKLRRHGVRLDLHGDDLIAAQSADPYRFLCGDADSKAD